MKVCLLTSTYKSPKKLQLLLKTIGNQTLKPNEILIADDGTPKEDILPVIEEFRRNFPFPIHHVWHEDKGFRKGTIINKAVAQCTSDYIIQVDGDCFLHKYFIEDHIKNAQKGLYLYGTRVHIREKFVPKTLDSENIHFHFFSKEIKKRPRILRIPFLSKLKRPHKEFSYRFRGCNMSFWRQDFITVNGYNEDIEGWGREDSELVIRFHNIGLSAKRLKFCGIVFHLDHKEEDKSHLKENTDIQRKTIEENIKRTSNGISKYL